METAMLFLLKLIEMIMNSTIVWILWKNLATFELWMPKISWGGCFILFFIVRILLGEFGVAFFEDDDEEDDTNA